jgi:hypothetical protein
VDTIVDGKAARAQFDLSVFAHVPEALRDGAVRDPTPREIEKALRDVGLSKNSAKAVLAGGLKAASAMEQVVAASQELLKLFNGGK